MLKAAHSMKGLEGEAVEALSSLLRQVPAVEIRNVALEPAGPDRGADFVLMFDVSGRPQSIVCEVKASGQPRHVRMRANARQSGLLAIASVRATTQETRLWQGEALQFVRGVPNGRSDVVEVRPGEIPGQIPDRESWNSFVFNIREFAPPRLGAPFDRPLPHINLDKVLQSLIA